MQQLFGATAGNQEAMDSFARVDSGSMSLMDSSTHDRHRQDLHCWALTQRHGGAAAAAG
jgi:hypothetical protein